MGTRHDLPALRKRHYISPTFKVRGGIATLTQVDKTFGIGDGILFDQNGQPVAPICEVGHCSS